MIGVAVVIAVLTVCCAVAVLLTLRVDAQMRARIGAMPGGDEPAAAWPVNVDDESAGPYLRGATTAAGLTGRR